MFPVFTPEERESVLNFILSVCKENDRIVSLIQVGSGAIGYHDARSDLDFVVALDKNESMSEVMDYLHGKIGEKYELTYFKQVEAAHLQVYLLPDLLEIDIGFGGYEGAAARKPAFKVLYDRTGVVEGKMTASRAWMDNVLYGDKRKKDMALAADSAWAHLMHAAAAIDRGNYFRFLGETELVRRMYIDLLGDRHYLESGANKETDALPEKEKQALKSTYTVSEVREEQWKALMNLTELLYEELQGTQTPVTKEMLKAYYAEIRK